MMAYGTPEAARTRPRRSRSGFFDRSMLELIRYHRRSRANPVSRLVCTAENVTRPRAQELSPPSASIRIRLLEIPIIATEVRMARTGRAVPGASRGAYHLSRAIHDHSHSKDPASARGLSERHRVARLCGRAGRGSVA